MDGDLHWSIWLISGLVLGVLSGMGQSGLAGMLVGVAILASPVLIYMKAGATILPFLLFYGGLAAMSSLFFKRRQARENARLNDEIAQKKKRLER